MNRLGFSEMAGALLAEISRIGGGCLRQGETVNDSVDWEDDVLPTVQFVSDGASSQPTALIHVPKGLARDRIKGHQILGIVGSEEKMSGGGENARLSAAAIGGMLPASFAGLIVDSLQHGFRGEEKVAARPSFGVLAWHGQIKDSHALPRVDVEKSSLGIEARGLPICADAAADQNAVRLRLFIFCRNRLAAFIETREPVGRHEWLRQKSLAVGAIEHEEHSIFIGLREHFPRLALEGFVKENGRHHRIPIMRIVRRALKIPNQFSSVRIERNDRAGIKIRAHARVAIFHRMRIASAPVKQIEFRIVRARQPSHTAAASDHVRIMRPGVPRGIALLGHGIPTPLNFAVYRINGFEETGKIRGIAGSSLDQMIANHERGHCAECFQRWIGDLNLPEHLSRLRIDAEKLRIESVHVEAILPHRDAFIASTRRKTRTYKMPNLAARARVRSPDLIATRNVQNAI